MLDLGRMEVEVALVAVDVDQDLRRVDDGSRGVEAVAVADQGEIGQRLAVVDAGAGEHEEVAQHPVGVPEIDEVREAIEDEHGPRPGGLNDAVHFRDEGLELGIGREFVDGGPQGFGHQRVMVGEAEVDQIPALGQRGLAVGNDEGREIGQRFHLPHEAVARHQAVQNLIQSRQPRGELRVGHRILVSRNILNMHAKSTIHAGIRLEHAVFFGHNGCCIRTNGRAQNVIVLPRKSAMPRLIAIFTRPFCPVVDCSPRIGEDFKERFHVIVSGTLDVLFVFL